MFRFRQNQSVSGHFGKQTCMHTREAGKRSGCGRSVGLKPNALFLN